MCLLFSVPLILFLEVRKKKGHAALVTCLWLTQYAEKSVISQEVYRGRVLYVNQKPNVSARTFLSIPLFIFCSRLHANEVTLTKSAADGVHQHCDVEQDACLFTHMLLLSLL